MADIFKLDAYLTFVDRMISQNRALTEPPPRPLGHMVKSNGKYFIEVKSTTLNFVNGYKLRYTEHGKIDSGNNKYKIQKYSYHFEGRAQGLHAFRIDRDINNRPHANHENYRHEWAHRLFHPEDIELDISNMGIPLFVNIGQLYISTNQYPLLNEHANLYNESNTLIRREIVWI